MNKGTRLILTFCLTLACTTVWAQNRFTLEQAVEHAKKNSLALSIADYGIEAENMNVKSARAQFLPSLVTQYSYTQLNSDRIKGPADKDYLDQKRDFFSVKLTQPLYSGGQLISGLRQKKAQKRIYEAQKQFEEISIVHKIKTLFFQLMKSKEDVSVARDTVLRLASNHNATQAYFDREMVPLVSVLESRVALSRARQELRQAENLVKKDRSNLMTELTLPLTDPVTFVGVLEEPLPAVDVSDIKLLWEKACRTRPDIIALEREKEVNKEMAKSSAGQYLPSVSLDGGYYVSKRDYKISNDSDQTNQYWQAGVLVSWNLFDGGSAWYQRQKYHIEIKKLDAEIQATRNTLKSSIQRAVLQLKDAHRRISTAKGIIEVAHENYEMEKKYFEKGLSTTPKLLDAQARLSQAQGDYNNAIFDYRLSMADLDFLMGGDLKKNN